MDAVVDLLISKVAQTVEENASLILGIKDQVEDLLSELRSFKAYLTEASKNESCNANAVLRDVVQKIQKVVTDAEDAIDKYLVERRNHRARPVLKRWAEKVIYYNRVNEAAKEIESIKKRAERIRLDHAHSLKRLQDGSPNNPQPAVLQNAQHFESNTALCKVCTKDNSYIVRCCVKGSLLEVNERLVERPELLISSAEREGYIAIIMPKPADWLKIKASLLGKEDYCKLHKYLGFFILAKFLNNLLPC